MPEGHTLHRLATALDDAFAGHPVRVSSPQGRFTESAALLDGRTVETAESWGKHLWVHFAHDDLVHVHLGLYGKFTEHPLPLLDPVGQVRMRMVGAEYGTDLRGPTVCEVIHQVEVDDIVARLGPDPLRRTADASRAWERISKSRRAIGALLMDQKVIAGVGNVYRSELLFRHRIEPHRPGTLLTEEEFDAAWTDLVALMKVGVRRGKIITVRPEDDKGLPGLRGRPRRYVYRRTGEPCRVCGTPIRTEVMEARNLFWCPTCQV